MRRSYRTDGSAPGSARLAPVFGRPLVFAVGFFTTDFATFPTFASVLPRVPRGAAFARAGRFAVATFGRSCASGCRGPCRLFAIWWCAWVRSEGNVRVVAGRHGAAALVRRGHAICPLAPAGSECQDVRGRACVQDIIRRQPSLPRDADAYVHAIEPARRVRVGPDLDRNTELLPACSTASRDRGGAGPS